MGLSVTNELIDTIKALPLYKQRALLELLGKNANQGKERESKEQWRKKLLTTSAWSDSEIEQIENARKYINQ